MNEADNQLSESAPSSAASGEPWSKPPSTQQKRREELIFVGFCYIVATIASALFNLPGFLFNLVFAVISGAFMLRQRLAIRVICFLVLLLSLYGMLCERRFYL